MPGVSVINLPQLIHLIERYEMPKTKIDPKVIKGNKKTTTNGKTTKAVVKNAKPVVTHKKEQVTYEPTKNSMRYFILKALTREEPASIKQLKHRAAKLAEKAGVKKYANSEAYKAFDVAFFVKHLESKGIKIKHDGEKYAVVS